MFVIRRSWHTDIGFEVRDLQPALTRILQQLPEARYVLFGFGDRHYLVNKDHGLGGMVGALWPGPAVVLVTGLTGTPEQAFGATGVVELTVSTQQLQRLETFIWNTLATQDGQPQDLGVGPYAGSEYFASGLRYSGFNTCNAYTATALHRAGLPVRSFAVEFSAQVWRQVLALRPRQSPAGPPQGR